MHTTLLYTALCLSIVTADGSAIPQTPAASGAADSATTRYVHSPYTELTRNVPSYGITGGYGVSAVSHWPQYAHQAVFVSPYYYTPLNYSAGFGYRPSMIYTPTYVDPYAYHFGSGFSGASHYRFPYYSYRRPWYFQGPPVYNFNVVW